MKLIIGLLLSIFTFSCSPAKPESNGFNIKNENILVKPEVKTYFDSCGVEGSIVILDNSKNQWIVSDTNEIYKETLPASTFKIINLLIALETNTIKDENEVVKWVGTTDKLKYGDRPEIYHDMTVKEAFEVSAGWVFIEFAKKIGKEKYKQYLSKANYGNLDLSIQDTDFWNFGSFGISPVNQVQFLQNLYKNDLPFSKRNMEIVKRVMITEQNNTYTIRAKTGWTRENNTNTGWWVGYLEANNGVYFFATRLLQDRKNNRDDFGLCRKNITKKVFQNLEITTFVIE